MHISEGVLSPEVLIAGAVLTAGGLIIGLRKLESERVPRVAVLSSALFVASLIHVPVGPSNMHLILNGLAGLILGWSLFPAFLVVLFLQAILFQFGGLTVLGVNTFNLAMPGVLVYIVLRGFFKKAQPRSILFILGFTAGFTAVVMSGLLLSLALFTTGKEFAGVAAMILIAHVPVMIAEGIITGFAVVFLKQVKPELLEGCGQ